MVCHGIIQTDQGMVVVPSDGTPARIDSSVRMEIDRNSIPDRTIVMPEDQAAKLAREELGLNEDEIEKGPETDEVIRLQCMDLAKWPKATAGETAGAMGFTCNICGKEVKTQRGLGQHIKMTHNLKGGQK
jgi:hypothetical protein